MTRPLLITDCDEVLLHMVSHFRDWLGEAHDVDFAFETGQFGEALSDRRSGEIIDRDRVWPLLGEFFEKEMHRQTPVPGAIEALGRIGEFADIVILNYEDPVRSDPVRKFWLLLIELDRDVEREEPGDKPRSSSADAPEALG